MTPWNPDAGLDSEHELVRLTEGADTLLAKYDGFLQGDHEAIPMAELEKHVEETQLTADLAGLEEELRDIKSRYPEHGTEMDGEAAVAVREHVSLTRSQASDSGIWHAFCVLYFPWFVDHRWEFNGISAMKKKFWTQGTALDSVANTFERLWWIAELSRGVDSEGSTNYVPTIRAFDKRRFTFRVFDIKMGRYKPAVEALLEVLYDQGAGGGTGGIVKNNVIDGTIDRFLKSGSTFPYESQTKSDLVETLEDIRADVEAEVSETG